MVVEKTDTPGKVVVKTTSGKVAFYAYEDEKIGDGVALVNGVPIGIDMTRFPDWAKKKPYTMSIEEAGCAEEARLIKAESNAATAAAKRQANAAAAAAAEAIRQKNEKLSIFKAGVADYIKEFDSRIKNPRDTLNIFRTFSLKTSAYNTNTQQPFIDSVRAFGQKVAAATNPDDVPTLKPELIGLHNQGKTLFDDKFPRVRRFFNDGKDKSGKALFDMSILSMQGGRRSRKTRHRKQKRRKQTRRHRHSRRT